MSANFVFTLSCADRPGIVAAITTELAALGAIVLDMTDVKALDSSNHGKFAQLAAVAPQLRAVLEAGVGTPVNPADEGKEVVGGSLQSLLSLPITIVRAPVRVLTGR